MYPQYELGVCRTRLGRGAILLPLRPGPCCLCQHWSEGLFKIMMTWMSPMVIWWWSIKVTRLAPDGGLQTCACTRVYLDTWVNNYRHKEDIHAMTEEDKIPLPFIYYLHTNKKGFQHIPSDIAGKSCLCVCERGGKWCVCKIKLSLHAYHLASKLLSRDRLNGQNRNSLILVSCCILIPASILSPAPLPVYLFN